MYRHGTTWLRLAHQGLYCQCKHICSNTSRVAYQGSGPLVQVWAPSFPPLYLIAHTRNGSCSAAHHNRDTFFQRSSVLLARCPRPCVLDSAILQMFLNPLQKKVNAQKQTTLDNINRTNWRAPVPATTCKTFLATNKQTYLLKCFRQSYSHFISTDLKKPLAGADKKKQQ